MRAPDKDNSNIFFTTKGTKITKNCKKTMLEYSFNFVRFVFFVVNYLNFGPCQN